MLHRTHKTSIVALEARWGLSEESSFREAMKGILEENFPVKVEKYRTFDEEGAIFG